MQTGCYGAVFRNQFMLCFYGIFVACGILAFVVLTAGSTYSWILAHAWKARGRMDPVSEADVQTNFDEMYCLSQAAYLCTSTPASSSESDAHWQLNGKDDLRDLFFDRNVSAMIKRAMHAASPSESLADICSSASSVLAALHDKRVDQACEWCIEVSTLHVSRDIIEWVNALCVPTFRTAEFCVLKDWTRTDQSPFLTGLSKSPYAECRPVFLSYWEYLSKYVENPVLPSHFDSKTQDCVLYN